MGFHVQGERRLRAYRLFLGLFRVAVIAPSFTAGRAVRTSSTFRAVNGSFPDN
jgi:hypothetical protein